MTHVLDEALDIIRFGSQQDSFSVFLSPEQCRVLVANIELLQELATATAAEAIHLLLDQACEREGKMYSLTILDGHGHVFNRRV